MFLTDRVSNQTYAMICDLHHVSGRQEGQTNRMHIWNDYLLSVVPTTIRGIGT